MQKWPQNPRGHSSCFCRQVLPMGRPLGKRSKGSKHKPFSSRKNAGTTEAHAAVPSRGDSLVGPPQGEEPCGSPLLAYSHCLLSPGPPPVGFLREMLLVLVHPVSPPPPRRGVEGR